MSYREFSSLEVRGEREGQQHGSSSWRHWHSDVRWCCRFRPGKLTDPPKRNQKTTPDESESRVDSKYSHEVPTSSLFVLYGMVNGRQCKILKDDGWNTNIISVDFVSRNKKLFKIMEKSLQIDHSNKGLSEVTPGIVLDAEVQIGKHK